MYGSEQITEILIPHGTNTGLKNAKITGMVAKTYDKQLKGYFFPLDVSCSSKIIFPKDEKIGLGIIQPFLVMQLWLPAMKQFSVEVTISDANKVF